MTDALSMDQTAQAVGLSRERFRRVWKTWARDYNFPAPFRAPDAHGRGSYAWDGEDVTAWKARRKAALGCHAPDAQNDNPPPAPPSSREARAVARDRDALRRLRQQRHA